MTAAVQFDAKAHEYRRDGIIVPSVSEILRATGIVPTWAEDRKGNPLPPADWYMERGRMVHEALHFHNEGDLAIECLDTAIVGFVQAAINAIADLKLEAMISEEPMVHPTLNYAGTPDAIGISTVGDLWDWKCGSYAKWHPVQRAAYKRLANANGYEVRRTVGIELRADGTFKISKDHISPAEADQTWLSALNVFNFGRR